MKLVLSYQSGEVLPPRKLGRVVLLLGVVLAVGWVIGGVTNAINALVSSEYFGIVIGRSDFVSIVLQGLLESTVAGFLLWVLLLPVYCVVTECRLPLRRLGPVFVAVFAIAIVCHVIGGLVGYGWAKWRPASFIRFFYDASGAADVPRFGYVRGAIWAIYASGVIGLVTLYVGVVRVWLAVAEAHEVAESRLVGDGTATPS